MNLRIYRNGGNSSKGDNGNCGMSLLSVRMTAAEVAKLMGITPQRVHQIEAIALTKLRAALSEEYRNYFGKDFYEQSETT